MSRIKSIPSAHIQAAAARIQEEQDKLAELSAQRGYSSGLEWAVEEGDLSTVTWFRKMKGLPSTESVCNLMKIDADWIHGNFELLIAEDQLDEEAFWRGFTDGVLEIDPR